MDSEIGDVRDLNQISKSMSNFNPDILIHMAAQPLVRLSYLEPVDTYTTNVIGTVNVLEAARNCLNLKAIVSVTTDKCYENKEWDWGYRESEPMGGHDPYSSSKGCAELVISAYRRSFFSESNTASLASASVNFAWRSSNSGTSEDNDCSSSIQTKVRQILQAILPLITTSFFQYENQAILLYSLLLLASNFPKSIN